MLASELIEEVRSLGSITPDTVDTDILKAADAEIRTRLLPMVRTINEEYLVRTIDVVSINGRVALPPRATGAALRMVQVLTGSQLGPPLPRMDPAADSGVSAGGPPYGFYFDGGGVVLLPSGSSATVRLRYYARPGKLVLDTNAASAKRISAVVTGATTTAVTCAFLGDPAFGDIISYGPAHQQKAIAANPTGAQPNFVFLNSELLEVPVPGDYMSLYETTPFVALPEELGSTVALRTAARILASLGYLEEAQAQYGMADTAQSEAEALLRPRSDGNPKRLSGGTLTRLGWNGVGPWNRW